MLLVGIQLGLSCLSILHLSMWRGFLTAWESHRSWTTYLVAQHSKIQQAKETALSWKLYSTAPLFLDSVAYEQVTEAGSNSSRRNKDPIISWWEECQRNVQICCKTTVQKVLMVALVKWSGGLVLVT